MIIRPETTQDFDGIRAVNVAAFASHPFSQQTEHLIVEALRDAEALSISLVADLDGEIVGHVAFSEAEIGGSAPGWYLLGPIAVLPERQGRGIGRALVERGLAELRLRGASGCVLVGDPAFYTRFGFASCPGVTCEGVPDENVLCLAMKGQQPTGEVRYHPAFFTGM